MRRPKLTMAAEIAAIGALVIAVVALVVVVFFDTGVRMPWDTEVETQPSPGVSVTSQAASTPSASTTPAPTSHPADPTPPTTGPRETILDKLLESNPERDKFWTSWLGLCLVALGSCLAGALISAIISFLIDKIFVPVSPGGIGVTIVAPPIVTLYLWLFWPFLSSFWIAIFLTCTATLSFWWKNVLDDHL